MLVLTWLHLAVARRQTLQAEHDATSRWYWRRRRRLRASIDLARWEADLHRKALAAAQRGDLYRSVVDEGAVLRG
ncbi:MAG: hypothetical protein M3340_08670 [Actinomycetota bacterium]|nr:hypothetical protein [Actinomycetota bacterium]